MNEAGPPPSVPAPPAAIPGAREQIAGLTFALLLIDPDLLIRELNPAAESLIGRSARRLAGVPLGDVLGPGTDTGPDIGDKLAQSDAPLVARGVALHLGGRALRVDLTVSPLADCPGWRVVTLSDSTQGERFSEDDRDHGLRAPAILAHEIKNPLAAIRGAAQLVSRRLGPKDRSLTDLIADEVDRIAQLIDRMQRLGREPAEPVASLNLHAAIRRACDTLAAGEAPLPLREEFDPSLPPVLANEGALVQVLINLIGNARDACRDAPDPQVVIRTRFVSGLVLNTLDPGRRVKLPIEVRISDNGSGLDPALRDHVFEPFVTTKKNGQGLGLALVRKLVRDMNGRISHERDAGGWTHFRVHLPAGR